MSRSGAVRAMVVVVVMVASAVIIASAYRVAPPEYGDGGAVPPRVRRNLLYRSHYRDQPATRSATRYRVDASPIPPRRVSGPQAMPAANSSSAAGREANSRPYPWGRRLPADDPGEVRSWAAWFVATHSYNPCVPRLETFDQFYRLFTLFLQLHGVLPVIDLSNVGIRTNLNDGVA